MTELANLVALSMKVQGLGAGGMLSLVQVIVTDIVSMRGKYTAMTAFSWALATIIGVGRPFRPPQALRWHELTLQQ
jgi:MFS family permease